MNLEAFDAQLKAEGYQVIASVDRPAGYVLGEHVHEFDACALILEGAITLRVDGHDHHYRAGEIFRLPAGTTHSEWAGSQGVRYRAARRTRES